MRALERQPSPQRFVIDLAGSSMVAASPPIPWAPLMGPLATQGGTTRQFVDIGKGLSKVEKGVEVCEFDLGVVVVITRITDI